jgi:hypothetical protein
VAEILRMASQEMKAKKRLELLQQAALEMHNSATVLYLFPQTQNLVLSERVKGLSAIGNRVKMESLYFP